MLYTPEEAAEKIRHITAYEIRRRISNGEVEYTAGARGKFLLTEEQIEKFVASLTVNPRPPGKVVGLPPGITPRSAAYWRKRLA